MKKKYLAITLGLVLGASAVLAGCAGNAAASASNTGTHEATSEAAESGELTGYTDTTIYGEVAEVNGNEITLNLGEKTDGQAELTLTGESTTITAPDDVAVTRGMGGMMGGPGGQMPGGEMPSGEMPSGEMPSGEMPTPPDGQTPPDMSNETLSLADIAAGDTIAVTFDADGNVTAIEIQGGMMGGPGGQMPGGMGGPGSSDNSNIEYTAANEYTTDTTVTGEALTSTGTDENAALITNGAAVTLDGVTVTRESSDSSGGDNASFYGVGAAVLTTDGTTTISDATISTDASGGAGVFSYGDGVTYVEDSTITTAQGASGGIHVAGGGTLYAWDLDVTTEGGSSAAIRSDRGSGTMVVDGGSYTSNGSGSPAIYSTADITVNDADLTATGSEAICIEGLNSIRLFDCDLSGNMPDDQQNDCTWNVILYQSMSGDSEVGNSTFEMVGGTLTAKNGGMFYTTNTESTFILKDVDITYADENDFFLKATGNSNARGWGQSGSNGADCTFTAISQEMAGDVIWDSISTLNFYMTDGSTLTGAVVNDESNAGNGGDGTATLTIDESSTWVVTGDSALTTLACAGKVVDTDGNTVTIQGTDGTVYVQGNSSVTVTVDHYSNSADVSGAGAVDAWSDYEVAR